MRLVNKRWWGRFGAVATGAVALSGLVAWSAVAMATPPTFTRADMEDMARGHIPEPFMAHEKQLIRMQSFDEIDVFHVRLTLQPGMHSGWHRHDGPVVTTVEQGTVTSYDSSCDAQTFSGDRSGATSQGDAFIDHGDLHLLRNETDREVVLQFTAFLPTGSRPFDSSPPAPCTP